MAEYGEGYGDDCKGSEADAPTAVFPPFVYEDAETVESTPSDKVEGGTMPKATEKHGIHIVDIGAEGFSMAFGSRKEPQQKHHGDDHADNNGEPEVFQAKCSNEEDCGKHSVRSHARSTVATEWNVEIVA